MDAGLFQRVLDTVRDQAPAFMWTAAVVGILTMAVIQTVKDLFPLRRAVQRQYLLVWMSRKARDFCLRRRDLPVPVDWEGTGAARGLPHGANHVKAEADLVGLAASGDRTSFYDLPIEQMCGQMAAAAAVVLDFPQKHPDLLLCLAALADPHDLKVVLENTAQTPGDLQALREKPAEYQALVDARNRLMNQVQRSIDGFQVSAGYSWKWWLQVMSFGVAYLITVGGLAAMVPVTPAGLGAAAPVALVGGFLAPIARDVIARAVGPRRS